MQKKNNKFDSLSHRVGSLTSASLLTLLSLGSLPLMANAQGDVKAVESLEEIVVTGSRIQRSGFETSTPVNVVGQAAIEDSGYGNVYDVLKSVPSIGVGLGGSNSSPEAVSNAQAGAAFVNLRGLGTDRSLVLVNGRRRVSGSSDSSAVDVSMIPAGMIERVEIITGGASAVYGADAVSGVVNLIMKDDIDGLEMSVGTGASTEGGGGERVSFDLAGGSDFAEGRGSMVFGLSYSKEDELTSQQRDFSKTQLTLTKNPDNTSASDGIPDRAHFDDVGLFAYSPLGSFKVGGQWYTAVPNLRLIDAGETISSVRGIGAEGFRRVDYSRLRQEQEILSTRVSLNYEISEDVNFFVDADFAKTTSVGSGQPDNTSKNGGLAINTLQRDNPLMPADMGALLDANGLSSIKYNAAYGAWGLRSPTFERSSYGITLGLEGEMSNDWSWDVAFQESSYENNSEWNNYVITQNLANAIDVIADPVSGEPVCRSGASGCVPFFPLGGVTPSNEVLSYLQHTVLRSHRNEQSIASASLSGDIVDLPAGAIQFATGFEYREESISALDDGLARQGAVHLFRGAEPQDADMSVKEAYLEVLIPVISDQLDVEAAVRVSDYDTIGSTSATKIGINWAPSDDIRFRVSSATSVRAPNLSELFNPGVTTANFIEDPCDDARIDQGTGYRASNCVALGLPAGWIDPDPDPAKELVTGGNANLTEEESDSLTFGVVITPTAVEGLSVSIDYWDIEITDAVGSFGVADILKKCVDSPTIDNKFCPLITRDAQSSIARIDVNKVNVGSLNATGIDFQSQYGFGLWDGDFSMALSGSYLLDHEQIIDAGDPTSLFITKGNPDNPEFRSNLNLSYVEGPLSFSLNTRYIGSAELDPNALTDETIDKNGVPSRIYNDLIVGYEFDNSLNLTATVTNIADVNPPRRDGTWTGQRGNYDNMGRFISLRAAYNF